MNGKDIQALIIDAVDALLFGIPSSVLLGQIRKDYRVEYSDALKLVEKIQAAINEENIKQEDYIRNKDAILNQLYGYSPLGSFRSMLVDKYNSLNEEYSRSVSKVADLTSDLTKQQNIASEAAMNMGQSLGTEARNRGVLL